MTTRQIRRSLPKEASQKQLGSAAQGWRDSKKVEQCARSLVHDAQTLACNHSDAASEIEKTVRGLVYAEPKGSELELQSVIFEHRQMTDHYRAIADAHSAIVERAHGTADRYAAKLVRELTPELVRERLATLEAGLASSILQRFGVELSDPLSRARVFEAYFAQWEGSVDEDDIRAHEGIANPGRFGHEHLRQ